jgi:monothiol glutaredoxin
MSSNEPNPTQSSGTDPATTGPSNPIRDAIASAIADHDTILFMKGTPEAPACGFSARTVAMLQSLQAPFAAVDILPDPRIRQELSAISGWPTIPQLFVGGELIGGCDIVGEMYEAGELAEALGLDRPQSATEPVAGHVQPAGLTQIENRLG